LPEKQKPLGKPTDMLTQARSDGRKRYES